MLAIWVIFQSTDIHPKLTFDIFFLRERPQVWWLIFFFRFFPVLIILFSKTYIFYYVNAGPPYSGTPQLCKTHTTCSGLIHETSTLFSNMVPWKRSRKTDSKPRYSGLKHGLRCTMVQKNFYISPCTNNTDSLSPHFGVMAVCDFSSKVLQKLRISGKFLTSWVSPLRILRLVFILTSLYLLNHFFLPWIEVLSVVDSFGYKMKDCNQVPFHTLWSADAKMLPVTYRH